MCLSDTLELKASVVWQFAQFLFIAAPAAWQVVQVELFGFFAIAGLIEKSLRKCGDERGPGEYASLKMNVALTESTATMITPHEKRAVGQENCRSRVGYQLNCALPRRGLAFGLSGESTASLPASRLRLSQKIFNACSSSGVMVSIPVPANRRVPFGVVFWR